MRPVTTMLLTAGYLGVSSHTYGVTMEFWAAVWLILGIYTTFLAVFFRFVRIMHQKDVLMIQRASK
jgi:hypothetical protein